MESRDIPDTVTISASNGAVNNEYLKRRASEQLSAHFHKAATPAFSDTKEKHGEPYQGQKCFCGT
jgi:hypothetical protein